MGKTVREWMTCGMRQDTTQRIRPSPTMLSVNPTPNEQVGCRCGRNAERSRVAGSIPRHMTVRDEAHWDHRCSSRGTSELFDLMDKRCSGTGVYV